jgi:hypothetical protein
MRPFATAAGSKAADDAGIRIDFAIRDAKALARKIPRDLRRLEWRPGRARRREELTICYWRTALDMPAFLTR